MKKVFVLTLTAILIFMLTAVPVFACTTIYVGKDMTVDGSVMYAHSEELEGEDAHHYVYVPSQKYDPKKDMWVGVNPKDVWFGEGADYYDFGPTKLPQAAQTYSYVASKIHDKDYNPGDYTFGVNEKQVTVSNNVAWSRNYDDDYEWDIVEGGLLWSEYTQLILERAATAKEGVELIAGLLDDGYTLSMDPGTMYIIADPNEGWILEMHNEGQYVAKRLPDNGIHVMSNVYSIGKIDFDDPDTLYSDDVVTHAIANGWYKPAVAGNFSDFSFKDAYGNPDYQAGEWYNLRVREAYRMLNEAPVTIEKLMEVMRTSYEGTAHYKVNPKTGSPLYNVGDPPNGHRVMSTLDTEMSAVVQFREDMPKEIGTVMWMAMATSKTSAYVPYYLGAKDFPVQYRTGGFEGDDKNASSAYWAFRDLTTGVHKNYETAFPVVKKAWETFEQSAFDKQASIEAEAMEIIKKSGADAASRYLNDYSNSLAVSAYDQAGDLLKKLNDPSGAQSKTVNPTASTVFVNDAAKSFEAYNIDGNNYFKLRDLAAVLNGTGKQFAVGYDETTKAITLTSGKAYASVGGEMVQGDGKAKTASPTKSTIYLDGKALDLTVYNIGGNNFFKLRDLMGALDVAVTYNSATKDIGIDTSKPYVD